MFSPRPLFDEAIEAIQSTISEEDRKTFHHHANVNTFIEDLHSMCAADQKEHQRLLACSKNIASFSRAFAPYFDIVSIMAPVRPDWLAWFWGLLRLVFKVRTVNTFCLH